MIVYWSVQTSQLQIDFNQKLSLPSINHPFLHKSNLNGGSSTRRQLLGSTFHETIFRHLLINFFLLLFYANSCQKK